MRAYRNMLSRISGVQYKKHHMYAGKEILPREDFYRWSLQNPRFHNLFDSWVASGNVRNIVPSVDRIDPTRGYVLENMRWVEFSENCRNTSRHKPSVIPTGTQFTLF